MAAIRHRYGLGELFVLWILTLLPVTVQADGNTNTSINNITACSAYMGQVKINEVQIGSSGQSSASNHIELFNSNNVAASVWQKWQLVVYYKSGSGSISKKGGYYLSSGFTANGQFIYNNTLAMYLRNRSGRSLDIALVDQNGSLIDYLAINGKIQGIPGCAGTASIVNATVSSDTQGDIARLPDAGSWPTSVNNSSFNTMSRTNVCTSYGNDLFVSAVVDNSNPVVAITPVTYTITVLNASCGSSVSNISLTDTNISTANFTGLSYTTSKGSTVQGSSSLVWTVGTLAVGASASLTVTGTPINVGTLTTTASITTPSTGLVNTGDDSSSPSINVRDFNYVGFDLSSDQVTEGNVASYSASISANSVPTKAVIVNYTVSGTATSGDTNLPNSGSVTIDPSNSNSPNSATIDFTVTNDTVYEPIKTIILTITSISSADSGVRLDTSARTMTIVLNDDDHPILEAEYQMDETGWSGIAGEVNDTSGYIRDGAAAGASGVPSTKWTSPAKSGNPGTCAYGEFNGGSTRQSVDMGAVDLGLGGQTGMTVSAWVRWTISPQTGNQSANIISNNSTSNADVGQFWLQHSSLNTTNDSFQFAVKTASTRAYVSSTTKPVQNQWYHVVGIYDGAKLAIYVNGSLEKTAVLTGNIAAYSGSYPLTIGRWSFNSENYRAFQGDIDEVKIYNGPITAAQVTDLYNETHVCPVYTNGNMPSYFNCVEVGGVPGSNLYTKLANGAFNLDVVAVKADGTIETGYVGTTNKNVTLELVDGSGATACASRSVLSSGLTQTVSFAVADKGRKTVAIGPANYAYVDVRCRVTDTNQTPSMIGCSTDHFAIRPSNLSVTSSGTADASGQSATATPAIKTGGSFSMTATSDVYGYNGTPKLDTSKVIAHSGAVQAGILAGSFNSADPASGLATNSGFNYSEVGYFALGTDGVYDDTFAAVDSASGDCTADFSNAAVGGKFGCKFGNNSQTGYFGRFIPDHLQAQVLSNGSFAHACSTFSYNGQALSYGTSNHPMLDVYAYNASSPSTVTKNYTGKFARLQAGQFSLTAPTTDAAKKGIDNSNLVKLAANLGTPSLTDNGNGNLTLVLGNDSFTYQREANAMIAPFSNDVAITVSSIADSDGVTASGLPIALHPAGENIRYGRINLMNANGSELADLAVPMAAEYFDGKSFITNADDRCSVATIGFANPITMKLADTCVWDSSGSSGSAKCSGTAPAGESYLEGSSLASGNFNLYLKAPNTTGSLTVNAAVDNWMKFNWTGVGVANPAATATFGVYKGNSKQIYLRELY